MTAYLDNDGIEGGGRAREKHSGRSQDGQERRLGHHGDGVVQMCAKRETRSERNDRLCGRRARERAKGSWLPCQEKTN
jgi:hypothetical protein